MGKTTIRWKKPTRHPIFILLCDLRKAMVIPAKTCPVLRYGAGALFHPALRSYIILSARLQDMCRSRDRSSGYDLSRPCA